MYPRELIQLLEYSRSTAEAIGYPTHSIHAPCELSNDEYRGDAKGLRNPCVVGPVRRRLGRSHFDREKEKNAIRHLSNSRVSLDAGSPYGNQIGRNGLRDSKSFLRWSSPGQ